MGVGGGGGGRGRIRDRNSSADRVRIWCANPPALIRRSSIAADPALFLSSHSINQKSINSPIRLFLLPLPLLLPLRIPSGHQLVIRYRLIDRLGPPTACPDTPAGRQRPKAPNLHTAHLVLLFLGFLRKVCKLGLHT